MVVGPDLARLVHCDEGSSQRDFPAGGCCSTGSGLGNRSTGVAGFVASFGAHW